MRWTCDTSNITWRSKSSNDAWKCLKSALDLSDCPVMHSRLTDLPLKKPDSQTSSNGTVERSVSVEQVLTSSDLQRRHEELVRYCGAVPCSERYASTNLCQLVAHPVDDVEPVQLFMPQKRQAAAVLLCVADDTGSRNHNSLQLVCGGSWWLCQDHIAVVNTRCH